MKLKQQIESLLDAQPKEMQDAVREHFEDFWESAANISGECEASFSKLLKPWPFSSDVPPRFIGCARQVKVIAAVLAKIFLIDPNDPVNNTTPSGWAGLNREAKQWCGDLLAADVPAGTSPDQVGDFKKAQEIIRMLLASKSTGQVAVSSREAKPYDGRSIVLPDPPWTRPGVILNPGGFDS